MRKRLGFVDGTLVNLLEAKRGHFQYESGHHGDLWLDLEPLFLRPRVLRPFIAELAQRLSEYEFDAVCGALVGGAFVAQLVADELGTEFYFTEEIRENRQTGFYPVVYRLPRSLRKRVRGKRIAIVNDVINAGSAVRGTLADLESYGARAVAIGTLVVLGTSFQDFAHQKGIPFTYLENLGNQLWTPAECPLCASGVPLDE